MGIGDWLPGCTMFLPEGKAYQLYRVVKCREFRLLGLRVAKWDRIELTGLDSGTAARRVLSRGRLTKIGAVIGL